MGSTNVQRFTIDYPERTRGLVLAGTFATCRGNPAVVEFWNSAVSQLTDPIDPGFVREFQENTLAQPEPQAFLDARVFSRALRRTFRRVIMAERVYAGNRETIGNELFDVETPSGWYCGPTASGAASFPNSSGDRSIATPP